MVTGRIPNSPLKKRILEISHSHKVSHLGSCLTMVDIIADVYEKKLPSDIFILSAGHAALAWYVVLEKYLGYNAEHLFQKHGVHPNRDPEHGILSSAGSLGHGIGIAVGMAVAYPNQKVYCATTDGELAEGSTHEALQYVSHTGINNFELLVNYNGFSAYQNSHYPVIIGVNHKIYSTQPELGFLNGLDAHYHVMTDEEFKEGMEFYS